VFNIFLMFGIQNQISGILWIAGYYKFQTRNKDNFNLNTLPTIKYRSYIYIYMYVTRTRGILQNIAQSDAGIARGKYHLICSATFCKISKVKVI
jgi:hypothetical protein